MANPSSVTGASVADLLTPASDPLGRNRTASGPPCTGESRSSCCDEIIEGCGCRLLIDEASHMEPFRLRPPVEDSVDRALVAVEGKDDRLGGGDELDKPGFLQARRMNDDGGGRHMRSTTLTTRTFRLGACLRNSQAAATISRVGMSPAAANTTSGPRASSLLAQGQIVAPAAPCLTAASRPASRMGNATSSNWMPRQWGLPVDPEVLIEALVLLLRRPNK